MTEILIIIALLILNGLFAMCEIALVSSKKSRLEQSAKNGSKGATIALKLLEEPEKFLSTVQIGITLVGIIAGAYGGEAFANDIQPLFEKFDLTREYAEQLAFAMIVAVITYFSLIVGELVPKSIALNNPEKITIVFSPFMRLLARITYPVVFFLTLSTKGLLKIMMIKERNEPPVTEEELKYLIETGSKHGVIEKQEKDIMEQVFRFGDYKAQDIMVQRKDIIWIDVNCKIEDVITEIAAATYTKYPVCDGSLDNVIGVISIKDILDFQNGVPFDLRGRMVPPIFFPQRRTALKVLDDFRRAKVHIGFVVNEHGNTVGLITLHNLVENVMGDLPDIHIEKEKKVISREDGSFLIDGELKIKELKKLLKIKNLPDEKNYTTLAGLVIYQLRNNPKAGDRFSLKNYRFEIVDMDGKRVDKVLITVDEQ
jgi:putative hemolysin